MTSYSFGLRIAGFTLLFIRNFKFIMRRDQIATLHPKGKMLIPGEKVYSSISLSVGCVTGTLAARAI